MQIHLRRNRTDEHVKHRKKEWRSYGIPSLVFSGLVTGATLGGLSQILYGGRPSYGGLVIGSVTGLVLCTVLAILVRQKSERVRIQVQYAVCGLIPGFMIVGNPFVIRYKWGAAVGAIIFALAFGLILSRLLLRWKASERYLSFPMEGGLFAILNLFMSYAGDEIAQLLIHNRLFYIPHKEASQQLQRIITVMTPKHGMEFVVGKTLIGLVVPSLLVLVAFLWIGLALGANRRRPAFGVALTVIGGAMISYIGFKVAPMLFMPGSGLLWAGLVVGLLMIALAITALYNIQMRVPLGVVIIVLSILSFLGAAGGLIIGGILGIFGGAMITSWKEVQTDALREDPPTITPPPNGNLSM